MLHFSTSAFRWQRTKLINRSRYLIILLCCLCVALPLNAQTPTVSLTVSNRLSCDQQLATLTASSSCTGTVSYEFTGPDQFRAVNTTGVTSVSAGGDYRVVVSNETTGCVANGSVRVESTLHPDYLPLVDLYRATNGPNWINKKGWLTNCDPCSGWFGIGCTAGRVTSINLGGDYPANKLSGFLPASIGKLSELVTLDLAKNSELSGTIPADIDELSNLKRLDLSYTKFRGTVLEKITGLSSLQFVNFSYTPFSGTLPAAITNLSQLRDFHCVGNNFSGEIPADLGKLANLTQLSLSLNLFTGTIPTSIGDLTNLTSLELANNSLTGTIPESIGKLTNLKTLHLSGNQLTGTIPEQLSNLTAIQAIGVSANKLIGPIPVTFARLTQVEYMYLQQNQLSGTLPDIFAALPRLRDFRVNNNQLTGSIPASIGTLSMLSYLQLQNNRLTGCIPTSLSKLCGITVNIDANVGLPSWSDFCTKGINALASVQSGNWQDPTVWSCGRVPVITDIVTLRHAITVQSVDQKQARQLRYTNAGKVVINNNNSVKVGP